MQRKEVRMGNVRQAKIDELIARNDAEIKILRTKASKKREPMPREHRSCCVELRKANVWLAKAKDCIIRAEELLDEKKGGKEHAKDNV